MMRFLLASTSVAFDHVRRTMTVTGPRPRSSGSTAALDGAASAPPGRAGRRPETADAEMTRDGFIAAVERAKLHIAAGDAFQIVPSQRVRRRTEASPFAIYRALRTVNPSPYMFLLDMGGFQLIGSSPETHVRLGIDGTCELRPIAGTRPRGADAAAGRRPRRRADGVREGAGRARHAGRPGPQRPRPRVRARLGAARALHGRRALLARHAHRLARVRADRRRAATRSTCCGRRSRPAPCPARPRCGRCRSSRELEGRRRGAYAGAVGYLGFGGDMDTCIALRTMVLRDGVAYLQSGCGIVADSDPDEEYQEAMNKVAALGAAIDRAETGVYGR